LELEVTQQLQMSLEALQELSPLPATGSDAPPETTATQAKQTPRRRRSGRRALPAHLPRETIVHVHPAVENGCQCPDCGGRLRYLHRDTAEMLEFVPGYFKVICHVREKHSCVRCARIVQAGAPSRPIQRGLPGPALLAHIVSSKYCLHQPLYRQSQVYGFAGVPLDRSVLAQWVRAGDELLNPIVQAVRRYVLGGGHLHADDTPLPVLDPGRGRTRTGYLWTYVRDERGWGSQQPPAVWFEYAPGRGGEHPREHLRDFVGIVHCDGYAGMNELFGLFPWALGHREDDVVDELGSTAAGCDAPLRMPPLLVDLQVPVLEKLPPKTFLGNDVSLVRLKVCPLFKIGQVSRDATNRARTAGNLDHDFGRTPGSPPRMGHFCRSEGVPMPRPTTTIGSYVE
jgi:transposase